MAALAGTFFFDMRPGRVRARGSRRARRRWRRARSALACQRRDRDRVGRTPRLGRRGARARPLGVRADDPPFDGRLDNRDDLALQLSGDLRARSMRRSPWPCSIAGASTAFAR